MSLKCTATILDITYRTPIPFINNKWEENTSDAISSAVALAAGHLNHYYFIANEVMRGINRTSCIAEMLIYFLSLCKLIIVYTSSRKVEPQTRIIARAWNLPLPRYDAHAFAATPASMPSDRYALRRLPIV